MYNVTHMGCCKNLLSQIIGMLSIIVFRHTGYLTDEFVLFCFFVVVFLGFFLSNSSIARKMWNKRDAEQMGSWTNDMDQILIPAYEKIFSFWFVCEYLSIAVAIIKQICLCFHKSFCHVFFCNHCYTDLQAMIMKYT